MARRISVTGDHWGGKCGPHRPHLRLVNDAAHRSGRNTAQFPMSRISRFHLTKITTAAAKVEDHSSWLDVEQMPRQRKIIHFARIPVTAA
jgi:hypothetical protein